MATSKPPINLQASYDASDGWGIRVELGSAFSLSTGASHHTAKVSQRRATPRGNEGTPTAIFTLAGEPDEDIPALLRKLADVWETGEIAWPS